MPSEKITDDAAGGVCDIELGLLGSRRAVEHVEVGMRGVLIQSMARFL